MSTRRHVAWAGLLLGLLAMAPTAHRAAAHPWGGLVVDGDGTVFFTFVRPMVGDGHAACVWRLGPDGQPVAVLTAAHDPTDLVLARSPARRLFAAERRTVGGGHAARLWQHGADGWQPHLPETTDPAQFHIQAYAVADDGTVTYAIDDRLYRRHPDGTRAPVETDAPLGRVTAMAWGPAGALFLLSGGTLYVLTPDGQLRARASGLKADDPEHLPFSGANILFDLAVDAAGTAYIAYYGNRQVLRVGPEGHVTTLLQAQAPWSPHGVDVLDGAVYVLESTIGGGVWWKPWERPVIRPRVRRVAADGTVTVLYVYPSAEGGRP